ncbi:MAG: TerB N-terminal domain-containing protein [Coriobacteriales bacterium]|nr:TerB N-terminal domain-containing protein [Coriobacteriales bacterium]
MEEQRLHSSSYDDYVEIEYDSFVDVVTIGDHEFYDQVPAGPAVYAAQPIDRRASDPIRERFYKMRSLASADPFSRRDSELFVKQAQFMADFTDDYSDDVPLTMLYPCYQRLGYDQLRTYFSWRTEVRNNRLQQTWLSYIFLYIYELLNGIAVSDLQDGLAKLLDIWLTYRQAEPALDSYLPRWLKDYHIYYQPPISFTDFVAANDLSVFYPEQSLFTETSNNLAVWNSMSSYDVTKSKFYLDGNAELMQSCLAYVLGALSELCASFSMDIADLFWLGFRSKSYWRPFQKALFVDKTAQAERTVVISSAEIYNYENRQWTVDSVVYRSDRRELVGYLLKKTEACLRQASKYRFKITANPGLQRLSITKAGIPFEQFEQTIEQAVQGFIREQNRTVVTVDPTNLSRIREEALDTQDRLTVPDPAESFDTMMTKQIGIQDRSTVSDQEPQPSDGASGYTLETDQTFTVADSALPSDSNGWQDFQQALDTVERQALALVLGEGLTALDLKTFADQNQIMLEVLLDNINQKAVDYIGDVIMDTAGIPTVFTEYHELIKGVLI